MTMGIVLMMPVAAAAFRWVSTITGGNMEAVTLPTQPQLNDFFGVQWPVAWLRHRRSLFDEVAHGAVANAAAQDNIDTANAAR